MKKITVFALCMSFLLGMAVTGYAADDDIIVFWEADAQVADSADSGGTGSTEAGNNIGLTLDQQAILDMINAERSAAGLGALECNELVQNAAQTRAEELARSYSHNRPDGRSCFTILYDAGVSQNTWVGENIAEGQATAQLVMDRWMNSTGHKANILHEKYKSVGIGAYTYNGRNYWVQLFMG